MDKELQTIVDIEKLLKGLEWHVQGRVLDYVKARINYGNPIGLVGGTNATQLSANQSKR